MYKWKSGHNETWRGKFGVENWFANNVFLISLLYKVVPNHKGRILNQI